MIAEKSHTRKIDHLNSTLHISLFAHFKIKSLLQFFSAIVNIINNQFYNLFYALHLWVVNSALIIYSKIIFIYYSIF